MKNFISKIIFILALILVVVPALASAQTGTSTSSVSLPATCVGATGAKCTTAEKKLFDLKTRGVKEIDRRIASLTKLNDRVKGMRNLTDVQKSSISATVQSEIGTLSILKTQIIADTASSTIRSDVQAITKSHRIYALVMPQVNIIAAADRATTVITMLSEIGSKLQTRISGDADAASDTNVQKAMADYAAKLADAQSQVQSAVNQVTALSPDNGDKDKFQSNSAALKDARNKIHTAQQDLVAARKDAQTIVKVLMTNLKKVMSNATSTQ